MAKWKSWKNTADEEEGYSTVSIAVAWLMLHSTVFEARVPGYTQYSQRIKYQISSEDCGLADRLRLQVTLKFH